MGAPVGNQFWKLRNKHGRDAIFESSEKLWEAACEYFEWADKTPFDDELIFVGKEGRKESVPKKRPFSLIELCSYLDCNSRYFYDFKVSDTGKRKDFSHIITRIEDIIWAQQYGGAVSGFFKENIISRKLGLADKKEIENNQPIINISALEIIQQKIIANSAQKSIE